MGKHKLPIKNAVTKKPKKRHDINGDEIKLTEDKRCSHQMHGVRQWKAPKDMPDKIVKAMLLGKMCGGKLNGGAGYCTSKHVVISEKRPPPYRCPSHGGTSTTAKGQKPGMTHGLYTDGMFEDEKELWATLDITGLDDEIKMAKLRLRRALKADKMRNFNHKQAVMMDEIAETYYKGYARNIGEITRQLLALLSQRSSLQETALALKTGGQAKVIIYLPDNGRVTIKPEAQE